ncbi:hypothetical protein F2Q70_00012354 [Brassica cretica]|uniref:Uncharacterized protein n=1 Tax=Brassica cretica TaxID=69181 RepID=A0A8S9M0M4_BRACR|nr:hypothetical protein F2Q70_00012354 [Brassica cretica]
MDISFGYFSKARTFKLSEDLGYVGTQLVLSERPAALEERPAACWGQKRANFGSHSLALEGGGPGNGRSGQTPQRSPCHRADDPGHRRSESVGRHRMLSQYYLQKHPRKNGDRSVRRYGKTQPDIRTLVKCYYHYKKTPGIPRIKDSEDIPKKHFLEKRGIGIFRRTLAIGIFRETFAVGIFRGSLSVGIFRGDMPSEYSEQLRPSEYSEKPLPSEYSKEVYPLGYSEEICP